MRSVLVATLVALSTLIAVPALAGENGPKDGKAHATFPMPAAQFKQKVDARMGKARQHMESRASKLSADEAKALRAKFDSAKAKVDAEVAKAVADGTVTKDEAKSVRSAAREMGGRHGKGHGGKGHGGKGHGARAKGGEKK